MNYLIAFIIAVLCVGCVLIVKGGNRFNTDEWNDNKNLKWCLHKSGNKLVNITSHSSFPRILAFPDAETAQEFLNTFCDLIEEAKELL